MRDISKTNYRGNTEDRAEHEPAATAFSYKIFIAVLLHVAIGCVSLIIVADYQSYVLFDRGHLAYAIGVSATFSAVGMLFAIAPFTFGYFTGFYLFTVAAGFLWLNCFSRYDYDHRVAGLSAAVSALLFLLPALLVHAPLKQTLVLSRRNFEHLLTAILVLALATVAIASSLHFRLVSLSQMYDFRSELNYPAVLRYLIGIVPNALLPLAFAGYLVLRSYWKAAITLLIFPLFYPITLSKLAFFAPFWVLAVWIGSRFFAARTVVILSLLVPMSIGVGLMLLREHQTIMAYFYLVNIRMIAVQSSAIDVYNDFFASHPHTYFCQIGVIKALAGCPYQYPLAIVMQNTYGFGNLNASLFATEGVASVGHYLAPLAALVCGLIVAIGNRAAAGLPPGFVLVSASMIPQIIMNVPLTVTMVSHGTILLFAIWYVTPRTIFAPE
ncbi:hypothetical protein JQ604_33105 [Bradyrhizobium jicamae]|uniref:hypothetical protein n=1 Tax=Bradyrhizobium jicamae TaxID=280332 RepID=UPI001BA53BC7|nr:hypothetical protein [Bradyrhizobium jicamae]MBR0757047.1 hypothetical protein [Bradyrhizobium jicamae]